jgi:hypothetical protein
MPRQITSLYRWVLLIYQLKFELLYISCTQVEDGRLIFKARNKVAYHALIC